MKQKDHGFEANLHRLQFLVSKIRDNKLKIQVFRRSNSILFLVRFWLKAEILPHQIWPYHYLYTCLHPFIYLSFPSNSKNSVKAVNAKAPVMNANEFFPCCIFITCSQILIISYTFYGAYSIGNTRHSFYNRGVYNLMLCIIYYCLELKCEGSWRCLPRSP